MIVNLPPELKDLEIHVQNLLTQLDTSKKELSDLKKELEDNYLDRRKVFPLGTNVNAHYAVGNDVTQTIGDNSTLLVDFLDDLIVSPYVKTDVQNQRFYVQAAGEYIINAQILFNTIDASTQHMETRILVNGTQKVNGRMLVETGENTNANYSAIPINFKLMLDVGDEINIQVYQNNNRNVTRTVNTSNNYSYVNISFAGNWE